MKKNEWFVPWVFISILLFGMYKCFCDVFGYTRSASSVVTVRGVNIDREVVLSLVFLFISAITVFVVYSLRSKFAAGALVLLTIMAGGFTVLNLGHMRNGIEYLVFLYEKRMAQYTAAADPYLENADKLAPNIDYLLVVFAILCVVFLEFFVYRFHSRGYLIVFDTLGISMGMVFGKVPGMNSILLLIVGTITSLIWISFHERGGRYSFEVVHKESVGRKGFIYGVAGILSVLTLITGIMFANRNSEKLFEKADRTRKQNEQLMATISQKGEEIINYFIVTTGVDNDGSLSNEEPHYTESTVLRVKLQDRPTEDIYLRGFIGDTYNDGEWSAKALSRSDEFLKSDAVVNNVWDLGYNALAMYSGYSFEFSEDSMVGTSLEDSALMPVPMQIDYVGAGRLSKYAYLPYYTSIKRAYLEEDNQFSSTQSDYAIDIHGDNYCQKPGNQLLLNTYIDTSAKEKELYHELSKGANGSREMDEFFLSAVVDDYDGYAQYRNYAEKVYTALPENGLNQYKQYIKDHPRSTKNILNVAQYIRNVLQKNASYSFELNPTPEGEDYAEYFLFSQQKGYCEHFATAGTLLFRGYGIPARYVTGYRVDAKDFKKDSSGGYTAEVRDSDSHAWSEVFVSNMGWIREEMTPAANVKRTKPQSTSKMIAKTATPSPSPTVKEKVRAEKSAKKTSSPSPALTSTQETKAAVDEFANTSQQWNVVRDICMAIVVVVIIVMIILICVRWKRRRISKNVEKTSENNKKLCRRTKLFYQFLKDARVSDQKNQTDLEWLQSLGMRYESEITLEMIEKMTILIQKSAFSKQKISTEEFMEFEDMAEHIEKSVYDKLSKWRKFIIRIMGYHLQ